MTDQTRGVDSAGRRKKRMLTPSQKYEIWLQLLRQEVTQNQAAEQWHVDRSTIVRIRKVAKEGALTALSMSFSPLGSRRTRRGGLLAEHVGRWAQDMGTPSP